MTATRIIGVVLVIIGLVGLLLGGVSWTREKKVVDLGPIQASTQEHRFLPIPPVVGGAVLVAGIVLLVIPVRRRV